jgi:DNA repair protein RecO (recombination protein O)
MKQVVTKGIIIKRIAYGEADKILTVLTEGYGLVSMLAKGVRKPKSRLAGGLELFSVSDITYVEGRGELKTVTAARLDTFYRSIIQEPESLAVAYECMQLVAGAAQHSEEGFYFETLQATFAALNEKVAPSSVYVWCAMRLLTEQGSVMNLEKPLDSAKFSDTQQYSFSFDDMAFYTDNGGQYSPKHIKLLRLVGRMSSVAQIQQIAGHETLTQLLQQLLQTIHKLNKA